jgi:hypothetical protein
MSVYFPVRVAMSLSLAEIAVSNPAGGMVVSFVSA